MPVIGSNTFTAEEMESLNKIIHSRAIEFSQKFAFLVCADLVQEAWKLFYETAGSYFHPDRGVKVTTWFYSVVTNRFTSIAQRESDKTQCWEPADDFQFMGATYETAYTTCAADELHAQLSSLLSPMGDRLLTLLIQDPRKNYAELASDLQISPRDLVYLKDELRLIAQHFFSYEQTSMFPAAV